MPRARGSQPFASGPRSAARAVAAAALTAAVAVVSAATAPAGQPDGAKTKPGLFVARTLSDFTGAEEPVRRWNAKAGVFEPDAFQNISQPEEGVVRFALRYFPGEWWDTDRDTDNKDRQRAEVKGLGPAQKRGETFEYATTIRTDPALRALGKFCHVFQLKAVDGDNAPPLVALSLLRAEGTAAVRYWPGGKDAFVLARTFTFKPAEAMDVRIRVTTSSADGAADGAVLVSIDGDEFRGAENVAVFRPRATSYRAKWGFYRGFSDELPGGENWVEHRDVSVEKLSGAPAVASTPAAEKSAEPAAPPAATSPAPTPPAKSAPAPTPTPEPTPPAKPDAPAPTAPPEPAKEVPATAPSPPPQTPATSPVPEKRPEPLSPGQTLMLI